MKNFEKFLKKIGVKDAVIKQLSSEEDVNVDDVSNEFKTSFKDVVSNDPEFIQGIKDEIRGTELSKIEHKIKKTFGLNAEDIKDKKFDEIIVIAKEKADKAGSATGEELQSRMIELTKENKRLLEEVIPEKENQAKETIKIFHRENKIRSFVGSKSLIVAPEVVLPAVQSFLSQNYNLELDDKGEITIKTKNGLNPLNADGTKVLTFDEIVDGHLNSLKVIKQSNGGSGNNGSGGSGDGNKKKGLDAFLENAGNKNNNGGGGGEGYVPPGLQKAQQNVESLKQMKEFGQ